MAAVYTGRATRTRGAPVLRTAAVRRRATVAERTPVASPGRRSSDGRPIRHHHRMRRGARVTAPPSETSGRPCQPQDPLFPPAPRCAFALASPAHATWIRDRSSAFPASFATCCWPRSSNCSNWRPKTVSSAPLTPSPPAAPPAPRCGSFHRWPAARIGWRRARRWRSATVSMCRCPSPSKTMSATSTRPTISPSSAACSRAPTKDGWRWTADTGRTGTAPMRPSAGTWSATAICSSPSGTAPPMAGAAGPPKSSALPR